MRRLFSYKVARDFGFAPNPFFGICTLATCKPQIRSYAAIGDIVFGCGSKEAGNEGRLVFAMEVAQKISLSDYWGGAEFRRKRPIFTGSLAQAYGDNIYHRDVQGGWVQADSHHSFPNGDPNPLNIARDTSSDNVLIGTNFIYWGSSAVLVPAELRDFEGDDVCPVGRAYRSRFSQSMVDRAYDWFESLSPRGYRGRPTDWPVS